MASSAIWLGDWKCCFVSSNNKIFGKGPVEFVLNTVSPICLRWFQLYLQKGLFCRAQRRTYVKTSCFLKFMSRCNKVQTLHFSIHLNNASNFYITHYLWSFEKRYKNDFGMYTLQHMAKIIIVSLAKFQTTIVLTFVRKEFVLLATIWNVK